MHSAVLSCKERRATSILLCRVLAPPVELNTKGSGKSSLWSQPRGTLAVSSTKDLAVGKRKEELAGRVPITGVPDFTLGGNLWLWRFESGVDFPSIAAGAGRLRTRRDDDVGKSLSLAFQSHVRSYSSVYKEATAESEELK